MAAATRRVVAALVTVLALASTAACAGSSDDKTQPAPVCGSGTSHRCFDLSSYGNLYCTVQQTREWLTDGSLEPADLPAWADTATVAGSTLVFDFRIPPESDLTGAQYTQDLLNALRDKNLLVDATDLQKRDDCLEGLTQRKVAASEGGWPAA